MTRPIFTFLGPNYQAKDAWLAFSLLFRPWKWKKGRVEDEIFISSGRDALYTILKHLNLQPEDEVLLQAYTCVVVPNAILAAGGRPLYVDVQEDTFNMDPEELRKKITSQSKILIIQHTFGRLAEMTAIMAIAKEHDLLVIEDCAHALGVAGAGEQGLASFWSFGRDKCVSAVFGGLIKTSDKELAQKIKQDIGKRKQPSYFWIFQQLLHPVVVYFAKLTYNIFIGKLVIFLAKKLLLSKSVYQKERRGKQPDFVLKKMPNALVQLAKFQMTRLDEFMEHRKGIVKTYNQGLGKNLPEIPYLVYPVLCNDPEGLRSKAKEEGIYLGDWYSQPIAPAGVDYEEVFYQPGSCPVAEKLAARTVNLPTHINITKKDTQRIIDFIKQHA